MVWSHSRLASFRQCKYGFYLRYIVHNKQLYPEENNYFAELGSYVHEIIAMVLQGKLPKEIAADYYVDNYKSAITHKTKKEIMQKSYEACADYFRNEDFWWVEDYDVLGVEMKFQTVISGYRFMGFIDLLLRHKGTGKIVLMDHKSAKYFFKKDGTVYSNLKEEFESYKMQMYLYSHAVKERYGEFPELIVWNHYKYMKFSEISFNEEDYLKAIAWLGTAIQEVEDEEEFLPHKDYFYCTNLCNFRNSCEYAEKPRWKRK